MVWCAWKVPNGRRMWTKVKSDRRSKISNLSNWKEQAWKKSGFQRDSNLWPPRCRGDALPTELWSHTLGARVHINYSVFVVSLKKPLKCSNRKILTMYFPAWLLSPFTRYFFPAAGFRMLKIAITVTLGRLVQCKISPQSRPWLLDW